MKQGGALIGLLALAATLVAAPAAAQQGGGPAPADMAAIRGYTLTADNMHRMKAATGALRAAERADPSLLQEQRTSLQGIGHFSDALAAMARHPRITRFFHEAGLTDRDALLFPIVTVMCKVVVDQPQNAATTPVTPAQIAFYKAHQAELMAVLQGS